MKRSKKIMLRVLPVLMILMVVFVGNVFANNNGITSVTVPGGTAAPGVSKLTGNIWSTISVVVQVLAVAAVVFAGVRYMFASADAKADIKQQTLILVIGAVLVFAAVPLLNMIAGASQNLTK